jgi:hypothetical protein
VRSGDGMIPISNCFTLVCENKKDLEHMWWTCEMLYRNNAYFKIMRGSVIPFIKKAECDDVIAAGLAKTHQHNKRFTTTIKSLAAIDQLIANTVNQKRSALQLQSIMLQRFL